MEKIIFDSSCLSRTATFSVFVTERMKVIHSLNSDVFISTGRLAVNHCFRNSFSNRMFISKKSRFQLCVLSKVLQLLLWNPRSRPFFQWYCAFFFFDVNICSHLILTMHFLQAYFRTPIAVK